MVGLRLGPNKVSFIGLLQPIGDAVKLANKQINVLSNFNFLFYYLSSFLMLLRALVIWSSFFFDPLPISFKYSLLILLSILSFNSLNSILAGWRTFSKYSLIGRIRTVSQLISYESALYFCIFSIILIFFSFNYNRFFFLPLSLRCVILPAFFYIWVPSFLAELNRTPYDFSEGERELVRGFNTEFGSAGFTFLFLSEYSNIIFFSALTSFFFFSGFFRMFFIFTFFFIIWIRSVLPRYRFDKLISLAWKFFIPFLTLCFVSLSFGW